jgi:hypothetical protein
MSAIWNSKSKDNFETFAKRTIQAAHNLHYSPRIQEIVAQAWKDVGIDLRHLTQSHVIPPSQEVTLNEQLLQYFESKIGGNKWH